MLRSVCAALTVALLATAATGCSGATTEQPAASTSALTTGPINATAHGPAKRVLGALAAVPLRADQRTVIEQLAKDTEAKTEPVRKAREALVLAIADQVQAGTTIDRAALQPKIDAIKTEWDKVRPAQRAAFEKLHDILTPDQRTAFVLEMQKVGGGHEHGPGDGHGMHGRMAKWATDLGLSQDQQDQIRGKITDKWRQHVGAQVAGEVQGAPNGVPSLREGMRGPMQMATILDAFKNEKFSMDQVAPQSNEEHMHEASGKLIDLVESVLPILTADQRTIAATKLRERATHFEDGE